MGGGGCVPLAVVPDQRKVRGSQMAAEREFEKFRVEMLDSGEFVKMNVVCESKQAAIRVAMNAARDVRQAEVLDVRPVKVGFC